MKKPPWRALTRSKVFLWSEKFSFLPLYCAPNSGHPYVWLTFAPLAWLDRLLSHRPNKARWTNIPTTTEQQQLRSGATSYFTFTYLPMNRMENDIPNMRWELRLSQSINIPEFLIENENTAFKRPLAILKFLVFLWAIFTHLLHESMFVTNLMGSRKMNT